MWMKSSHSPFRLQGYKCLLYSNITKASVKKKARHNLQVTQANSLELVNKFESKQDASYLHLTF